MAVVVKYIVVRNGEEKMTFATKKEADQHDKMLDIADNLYNFLNTAGLSLDEKQMEDVALFLAENSGQVLPILRGINPQKIESASKTAAKKTSAKKTDNPDKNENKDSKPKAGSKK